MPVGVNVGVVWGVGVDVVVGVGVDVGASVGVIVGVGVGVGVDFAPVSNKPVTFTVATTTTAIKVMTITAISAIFIAHPQIRLD